MDFIGRLLVIERKDLPVACRKIAEPPAVDVLVSTSVPVSAEEQDAKDAADSMEKDIPHGEGDTLEMDTPSPLARQLGPLEVLVQLGRSPRALTAFGLEFTYAIILAALEPTYVSYRSKRSKVAY